MSAPRMVTIGSGSLTEDQFERVSAHLREGGLIAYPTETVYGLGGLTTGPAVQRLRELKPAPERRGFLIVAAATEAFASLDWSSPARALARQFWPGPLTIVLRDPEERYPPPVGSPDGTVAVRVTPHPVPARLSRTIGAPLTSTSANVPGGRPAVTGAQAQDAARRLGAGADLWVLDAGALAPGPPSTIVDATGREPRVVRVGAISTTEIAHALREDHERVT